MRYWQGKSSTGADIMSFIRAFLVIAIAFGLSACSSKFRSYNGPQVTLVEVHKAERKMYLVHNTEVLKVYDIDLGFAPVGHKQFEGDGKTPEGVYYISHKNPNSNYHLSLGISYPNDTDRAFAEAAGKPTGGDIFIHGGPPRKNARPDWTAGCISVSDKQIEVIYAMINPNTPIRILP